MAGAGHRSGISANLAVGVFSTAWSAIVAIVAIRWFVQLLGIEAYGLIGFFVTLQAAISILDLGLGSAINREVARAVALDDLGRVRRLIRSLEALYAGVALVIGGALLAGAPFIARDWLSVRSLDHEQVEWFIRLMGIVLALRWPIALYQGTLVGLHRARISYKIVAAVATLSNVGAILLLYAVAPTLWTYFVWQVAVAAANFLWMRHSAWRELGTRSAEGMEQGMLRTLLMQSVTVSGVAVTGLLLSQLDKLVVSATVPLADFARYSLAALIGNALVVILIPTFNVIYPRMSGLVASGKTAELVAFYRVGTRVLVCALIPISTSAIFYSFDLVHVWTGDVALAHDTGTIVRLLLVGATLNGIMHFPYALQLATGQERLALWINVANIVFTVPVMIVLATRYGPLGGAIGWMMQASFYFVIGVTVTHRFILKDLAARWLLGDVVPGVAAAVLLVGAGYGLAIWVTDSSLVRLTMASLVCIIVAALVALGRRDTRGIVLDFAGRRTAGSVGRIPQGRYGG